MARKNEGGSIPRKAPGYPYYICLKDWNASCRIDFVEPTTDEARASMDQFFSDIHEAIRAYGDRKRHVAPPAEGGE